MTIELLIIVILMFIIITIKIYIKSKTVSNNHVPYMNSQLRKAMNQRNMWRSKFFKNRNNRDFRKHYTQWRNSVARLRKKSINNYFESRCSGPSGGKQFFETIKPFMASKSSRTCSKIILKENDEILNSSLTIADVLNKY